MRIGNVDKELSLFVIKLTTSRRNIIQRFITFESDLFFLPLVSFTYMYSQCTHVHDNDVISNRTRHHKNYRNLLRNLSVGINEYNLVILRKLFSHYKFAVLKFKICVSFSVQYIISISVLDQ